MESETGNSGIAFHRSSLSWFNLPELISLCESRAYSFKLQDTTALT
jgi:hypothetical protein